MVINSKYLNIIFVVHHTQTILLIYTKCSDFPRGYCIGDSFDERYRFFSTENVLRVVILKKKQSSNFVTPTMQSCYVHTCSIDMNVLIPIPKFITDSEI